MKNLKISALAILLLAACSKDTLETNPSASASSLTGAKTAIALPFTATLSASADPNPNIPPTSCSGDIPQFAVPDFLVSGIANHLGLLNPSVSRLHHVSCDLSVTTMLLTTSVTVELAAANGDLIYCSGDDVINVANMLQQTGTTGAITGTWNITGGTGRFAGATGSFTIDGLVDFATNSFSCEATGTVTY